MKILLTGFGPFADVAENPSAAVVGRLSGSCLGGADVVGVVLPVEFAASVRALSEAIAEVRPAVLLCLGVARGRSRIEVETVARGGVSKSLDSGGEAGPMVGSVERRVATIDVAGLVSQLVAGGFDAVASEDAGGYVCDHVFFHAIDTAREFGAAAGFVHLPDPAGEAGGNWTVDRLTAAVAEAVAWLAEEGGDALLA